MIPHIIRGITYCAGLFHLRLSIVTNCYTRRNCNKQPQACRHALPVLIRHAPPPDFLQQAVEDTEVLLKGMYDMPDPYGPDGFKQPCFLEHQQLFTGKPEQFLVWRKKPLPPVIKRGKVVASEGESESTYLAVVANHGKPDEKVMFMRTTPTGCDDAELIDPDLARELGLRSKEEVMIMFDTVLEELKKRFPERKELQAQSLAYIHFWKGKPSFKVIYEHVEVIKAQYGCEKVLVSTGEVVAPLLCSKTLEDQVEHLRIVMSHLVSDVELKYEAMVKEASEEKRTYNEGNSTALLWQAIEASPIHAAAISEFVKYAKLVLVMVAGSVEDERTFSSMSYIQSDQRSSLQPPHLDACLRMYCTKSLYTLGNFPIGRAFDIWYQQKVRRMVQAQATGLVEKKKQ